MKKPIQKWVTLIINRPLVTLGLLALFTAGFIPGVKKLAFESSIDYLMPAEEIAYKLGKRVDMAFLDSESFMITSIEASPGYKLFSKETFGAILSMVEEIEEYKEFNLDLENHRFTTLLSVTGVSVKEDESEESNNSSPDTASEGAVTEETDDLEAQLDAMILDEGGAGEALEEVVGSYSSESEDLWDLDKSITHRPYAEAIRPRRTFDYENFHSATVGQIRESLDPVGARQFETVLFVHGIAFDGERVLTREDIKNIVETWETIYLYKSMEIVQVFMNPITGEDISGANQQLTPVDFIEKNNQGKYLLPETENDFNKYQKKIELNPLNEIIFYSKDDHGDVKALSLSVILKSQETYNHFNDFFTPLLLKYNREPLSLHTMGAITIEKFMTDFMQRDLKKFMPIVLFIVIITFYLNFRTISGVILPTLTVVIAGIWTMGLMGHLGVKISMLVSVLPPLLIAIGSSYSIHIYNQYMLDHPNLSGDDRKERLIETITHISITVFLAALTTMISFWTLGVSQVSSLRDFGVFAGLGALFAMGISFVLIPAVLILLKPIEVKPGETRNHNGIITWFISLLARASIRHTRVVMGLFFVIIVIGGIGISKVKPETAPIDNFHEDSYIVKSDRRINQLFNGSLSLTMTFDSGKKNGVYDPAFLQKIENLRGWLDLPENREDYNILSNASFSDFIKRMHMAVHDDNPGFFIIPETEITIRDYMEIFAGEDRNSDGRPDSFEQFVDKDYQRVNLIIRTGSYKDRKYSTAVMDKIVHVVTGYMDSHDEMKEMKWFFSGTGLNIIILANYIVKSQIFSILLSMAIMSLIVYLLFRAGFASILALIPISSGLAVIYGTMGFLDIPLDIPKTILSSIAIGIGIDDTIHYLKTLAHHLKLGKRGEEAVKATHDEAGLAIVYTSVALILGFSILTLSSFKPVFFLGLLVSSVMLATTVGALLFLPAFYLILNPDLKNVREEI